MNLIEIELLPFFQPSLLAPSMFLNYQVASPFFFDCYCYKHIYANTYMYMNIYIYEYIHTYTYIHIHTDTHTHTYPTYIFILAQKAPWMRPTLHKLWIFFSLFQAKKYVVVCYSKHKRTAYLSRTFFLAASPTIHTPLTSLRSSIFHSKSPTLLSVVAPNIFKRSRERGVEEGVGFGALLLRHRRGMVGVGSAVVFSPSNGHTRIRTTSTLTWSHGIVTPLATRGLAVMAYTTQRGDAANEWINRPMQRYHSLCGTAGLPQCRHNPTQ